MADINELRRVKYIEQRWDAGWEFCYICAGLIFHGLYTDRDTVEAYVWKVVANLHNSEVALRNKGKII